MFRIILLLLLAGCVDLSSTIQKNKLRKTPVCKLDEFTKDGDRFAVLVSIDEYADPSMTSRLYGAKNDMDALADVLLEKYGFAPGQVLRLHGPSATRQGILEALTELGVRAANHRLLVFAYAGHGSYRKDGDGEEEANGKDETICPYDRDLPGGGDILDDELHGFFAGMLDREALLTVILDSCYSGNAAKPLGEDRFRTAPPIRGSPSPKSPSQDNGYWMGALAQNENLVFLAAASEEEVAGEGPFPGGVLPANNHGYFSHALLRALHEAPSGWAWDDVTVFLEKEVANRRRQQHPRFLGRLNRGIFGKRLIAGRSHFRVAETLGGGKRIRLDHGLMSGIEDGSILALYRKGAARLSGTEGLAGFYRVDQVSARESAALWLGQGSQPTGIQAGDPAVHVMPGATFRKHRVFWDDVLPEPLENTVHNLLREDHFLLERGDLDSAPTARDFVIGIYENEGEKTFRVEGQPSAFSLKISSGNLTDNSQKLSDHISNAVRWERLRQIHNPFSQGFDARQKIQVSLQRGTLQYIGPGYEFRETEALPVDRETGAHRFRIGDGVRLSYRNTSGERLYVTVFYLNNKAEVYALNEYQYAGILQPGKEVVISDQYLSIGPLLGPEYLKIFVSASKPFHPHPFLQRTPKAAAMDNLWQELTLGRKTAKDIDTEALSDAWGVIDITIQALPNAVFQ